ncbi:hypothetical protein CYMTET_52707 [Cymbomonas tetramitiformis]|uniref:BRO1 domain-containing protein n=1 Tax=Cymbomonas tetramitiformis TaxID=36881 RepID=A0AAE0BJU5_9CHLO|nr:hypothetical protein CYMTET_52707 [Cymbomonas tetramitiformis]
MVLGYEEILSCLTTKPFSYEKAFKVSDSLTLETLRELDSWRAAAHHNQGPSSSPSATLSMIDNYLPLLENLVLKTEANEKQAQEKKLAFEWSSLDSSRRCFTLTSLQQERAMTLLLKAATMQHQAMQAVGADAGWTASTDAASAVQAIEMLKRSAGVFAFLASEALPALLETLTPERPCELAPAMAEAMECIALAQAQGVAAARAAERQGSDNLLAALHKGAWSLYRKASKTLKENVQHLNCVPPRLTIYLALASALHQATTCRQPPAGDGIYLALASALHQATTCRYLAQEAHEQKECGLALAWLSQAKQYVGSAQDAASQLPAWSRAMQDVLSEIENLSIKYDKENNVVYFQLIPKELPMLPEERVIVSPIKYEPVCLHQNLFAEF